MICIRQCACSPPPSLVPVPGRSLGAVHVQPELRDDLVRPAANSVTASRHSLTHSTRLSLITRDREVESDSPRRWHHIETVSAIVLTMGGCPRPRGSHSRPIRPANDRWLHSGLLPSICIMLLSLALASSSAPASALVSRIGSSCASSQCRGQISPNAGIGVAMGSCACVDVGATCMQACARGYHAQLSTAWTCVQAAGVVTPLLLDGAQTCVVGAYNETNTTDSDTSSTGVETISNAIPSSSGADATGDSTGPPTGSSDDLPSFDVGDAAIVTLFTDYSFAAMADNRTSFRAQLTVELGLALGVDPSRIAEMRESEHTAATVASVVLVDFLLLPVTEHNAESTSVAAILIELQLQLSNVSSPLRRGSLTATIQSMTATARSACDDGTFAESCPVSGVGAPSILSHWYVILFICLSILSLLTVIYLARPCCCPSRAPEPAAPAGSPKARTKSKARRKKHRKQYEHVSGDGDTDDDADDEAEPDGDASDDADHPPPIATQAELEMTVAVRVSHDDMEAFTSNADDEPQVIEWRS